jgi:dephospho-CoA kinase
MNDTSSSLRLGLTGGIGSGKSTVARLLAARGACVIDADAISRAATGPGGAAMPAIREAFGPSFVDEHGALHRERMRELVFRDPQARRRLEAIVHPIVGAQTRARVEQAGGAPIVFDVPLLVESRQWPARVDRVWVVDCSTETQVERVQARNGWPRETVEAVIRQQARREQRLAAADAVIFNDGIDLAALEQLVADLARRFGL